MSTTAMSTAPVVRARAVAAVPAKSLRPSPYRPAASRRPRLRLVPAPVRRAPRAPFIAVVILALAAGLIGLLVLNTQRAQDAFTLADLQHRQATLADSAQARELDAQQDRNPAVLASRAAALGMVPGGVPVFVDASGKVLGAPPAGTPLPKAGDPRSGDVITAGSALSGRGAGNGTPLPGAAAAQAIAAAKPVTAKPVTAKPAAAKPAAGKGATAKPATVKTAKPAAGKAAPGAPTPTPAARTNAAR